MAKAQGTLEEHGQLPKVVWQSSSDSTSLQQLHKLSLVKTYRASHCNRLPLPHVCKQCMQMHSEMTILYENEYAHTCGLYESTNKHKACRHVNKTHARKDTQHRPHRNTQCTPKCVIMTFMYTAFFPLTLNHNLHLKCSFTHIFLKPSGLFYWHLWRCQVKPCRADLCFHYHFKHIKLCQTAPEMDHLRSGARAHPTCLRAG